MNYTPQLLLECAKCHFGGYFLGQSANLLCVKAGSILFSFKNIHSICGVSPLKCLNRKHTDGSKVQ